MREFPKLRSNKNSGERGQEESSGTLEHKQRTYDEVDRMIKAFEHYDRGAEKEFTFINAVTAKLYQSHYVRKVSKIQKEYDRTMSGVGSVFPLTTRTRKEMIAQGKTFIPWGNDRNPIHDMEKS